MQQRVKVPNHHLISNVHQKCIKVSGKYLRLGWRRGTGRHRLKSHFCPENRQKYPNGHHKVGWHIVDYTFNPNWLQSIFSWSWFQKNMCACRCSDLLFFFFFFESGISSVTPSVAAKEFLYHCMAVLDTIAVDLQKPFFFLKRKSCRCFVGL